MQAETIPKQVMNVKSGLVEEEGEKDLELDGGNKSRVIWKIWEWQDRDKLPKTQRKG